MKALACVLCLTLTGWTAAAQSSQPRQGSASEQEAQLQLSTSVTDQEYTVESGSKLLRLMLELTYTNVGKQPILLDKKSTLAYRKLVSRNQKAAAAKKYVYEVSSLLISVSSFRNAGFRVDDPQRSEFVNLQPGESYSLKKEIRLRLFDGTRDTTDLLRPGTYFLQLRVATWYYFVGPDEYSREWQDEGYLWSNDVTSIPMPFTIKKTG